MTDEDIVIIHDGRVSTNAKLIKTICNKAIKKNKAFLNMRPASFATVYHNKEFAPGGFAAAKRASSVVTFASYLPEAVETVQVLAPKAMKLPIRKRKHCGDGSSLDRAWSGIGLRPESSRNTSFISEMVLLQCCKKEAGDGEAGREGGDGGDGSDGGQRSSGDESENEQPKPESALELYAWESEEALLRDLFLVFDPQISTQGRPSVIVDLTAGLSSALACVRDRRHYRGFVPSELVRSVMLQALHLEIFLAMQNAGPGFTRSMRVLSRAESLGGDGSEVSAQQSAARGSELDEQEDEPDELSESGAE